MDHILPTFSPMSDSFFDTNMDMSMRVTHVFKIICN